MMLFSKNLGAMFALLLVAGCQPAADHATETSATTTDESSVTLPAETAKQNGIVTAELKPASQGTATIGNASVLDVSDLVNAASQYAAAVAQRDQAMARLQASRPELERLRVLNADDHNVSDRVVQDAAAANAADEAAVRAANVSAMAAEASARQRWGAVLARGVARGAPWARELAAGDKALVEAVFTRELVPPARIRIAGSGGRAAIAQYLAPSPRVDARLLKPAHYYLASAHTLPIGMISTIAAPQVTAGVFVPASAVVWKGNQAVVFVEERPGHYVQQNVAANIPATGGFIETTLHAGQRVVVTGAQQLLSEGQKPEVE